MGNTCLRFLQDIASLFVTWTLTRQILKDKSNREGSQSFVLEWAAFVQFSLYFFCVCCLCFCNGGYVPQFFVCSSTASLYRCMGECRWLIKEKASRAPIQTIPLVFRSRNFGKVLVGITLMTQWQSHSWELAIWYPSFICCNRAHFFAFKLSGNAYCLQF